MTAPLVFIVQRVGPYHHARFKALAEAQPGRLHVLETRPEETVYSWAAVAPDLAYARTACPGRRELRAALSEIRPRALVCVGYSDPEVHAAARWALRAGVPLITCSDSTRADAPRRAPLEWVKRLLLRAFSAAVVAGARSREYLTGLGVPPEVTFAPWDVVDNAHFAAGAERVRSDEARWRAELGLPRRFVLCVARFVPKKNLPVLVESYAAICAGGRPPPFDLVLSGSGEGEPALRAAVRRSGLEAHVHFPGFVQYDRLPAYLGLAEALVLPSRSEQWGLVVNEAMAAGLPVAVASCCGCAPDLVRPAENGWIFNERDTVELAGVLGALARVSAAQRAAMGEHSRRIVAAFSPEAFARAVSEAVNCAEAWERRPRLLPRALLQVSSLRAPG